jgi:hypothetical protein
VSFQLWLVVTDKLVVVGLQKKSVSFAGGSRVHLFSLKLIWMRAAVRGHDSTGGQGQYFSTLSGESGVQTSAFAKGRAIPESGDKRCGVGPQSGALNFASVKRCGFVLGISIRHRYFFSG